MVKKYAPVILALLVFLSGCGGPVYRDGSKLSRNDRQKLASVAGSYLGASYRYGGATSKGFDCSGLVYRIYRQALGWKLPRTTIGQYNRTFKINSGKAKPGDLVFFRINGSGIDHVGMMISNYQFIHASISKGVIISDFGTEYYRKKFASIRRVK